MSRKQLFDGQSADGNSVTMSIAKTGTYAMHADGTFGGGTIQVQLAADDTWTAVGSGLTADGRETFTAVAGETLRLNLNGSTAPDLDAYIVGAP